MRDAQGGFRQRRHPMFDVAKGDAIFAQADRVDFHAGGTGMVGLVAYKGGGADPDLLQPGGSTAVSTDGSMESVQ